MSDPNICPGLNSPGPIYQLKGSFEKAAAKSSHPSWGRHGPHSLKMGRFRCEEVRFQGRGHMRELHGHFSPGPQYNIPTSIGGGVQKLRDPRPFSHDFESMSLALNLPMERCVERTIL